MPKMCELIHVGRIGNTPRKLACSHMKRRIAYGFDAASQFAAKNECADEHQQKAYQGRSANGVADELLDFFQVVRIEADHQQNGRASCRERVCQYVEIWVGSGSYK